ncbi:NADH-quinone oxidoreductase subunit L [Parvularcula flava]|uniref:NADH-quinone oxidoreductase subunit L n=1 Tax=Aquisalinus luteolus TaxID=1566827 RepID=A0A8J3A2X0_9PROT|nr:NADH-quinone oxidoreductase subunit L [Aquisalinus luteolus]NHK27275.1 NADH-quinone oxidoreductase subunit L [Aquisalinus luteolus]GGH94942.1 NADH-quinone oxidoreductase subunit L [Aquisalinus luteolus]
MEPFVVLLPLFGALLAMPIGRMVSARAAELTTIAFVLMACLIAWVLFFDVAVGHNARTIQLFTWIGSGNFIADWAVKLDTMSVIMLVVITSVSSLVHIYSVGYMHDDASRPRFFAYLSLFTFAMLTLVTADNFIQLFFGWEGVGLASYLLIGFYHHKKSANDAAIKAFVVNRVGDFGFALGIMAIFFIFGSVGFEEVFQAVRTDAVVTPFNAADGAPISELTVGFLGLELHALTLIGILLFIGAMGKSAQFFLHTWLPDAMEGPTPVSALIHAATMVTAGVFLVCRCSIIYENAPDAATLVTFIGATTAFFAATVGLLQDDIKKVIAYSTCSQLGYMFFAAGVGSYGAAMFHLFTHAFFKALLFLGAGSVIHAVHHEQDMKKMGGVRHILPFTYAMMIIGTIAITGVGFPFLYDIFHFPVGTAGFASKDAIIEAAYAAGTEGRTGAYYAFAMGLIAAVFTSFYSWRLIFLTFHGKSRAPDHVMKHPHFPPNWMLLPLAVLAFGALFAGMLGYKSFVGDKAASFWGNSIYIAGDAHAGGESHAVEAYAAEATPPVEGDHAETPAIASAEDPAGAAHDEAEEHTEGYGEEGEGHHFPLWVLYAPLLAMLIGFGTAFAHYMRGSDPLRPGLLREGGILYSFLKNKWYVDEVYRFLFLNPSRRLGRILWKIGDGRIIDGLGPDGLSGLAGFGSRLIVRLQSGYIYHYAFAMLVGIGVILLIVRLGGAQ